MSLKKFKELGEAIPKEKIILPLKHELFAQELIKTKGNQTEAYANTYDKDQNSAKELATSRVNASILLTKPNIRKRVIQILNEKNLSLDYCVSSLKTCVDSENEGIKLEATKTAFKLHDAFPSEKESQEHQDNSIQVIFAKVIVNRNSQDLSKPKENNSDNNETVS